MPSALSLDLRKRVVEAVEAGMSQRAAARRFAVSVNTITNWIALKRERGDLSPRPVDRIRPLSADPARSFLLRLVEREPHLSIQELRDALAAEGVAVSWGAVQGFLKRHGVERKPGPRPPGLRRRLAKRRARRAVPDPRG